jgi:hypothetical protein
MRGLALAAVVLVALVALVAACGSSTDPGGKVSSACAEDVGEFLDGLKSLDSRLDIGLTYAEYGNQLGDAKTAYDDIDWQDLDQDCIQGVGVDGEAALNHYLKAYTFWKDCIEDSGCQTDSIQDDLQAEWAAATTLIAKIRTRLP